MSLYLFTTLFSKKEFVIASWFELKQLLHYFFSRKCLKRKHFFNIKSKNWICLAWIESWYFLTRVRLLKKHWWRKHQSRDGWFIMLRKSLSKHGSILVKVGTFVVLLCSIIKNPSCLLYVLLYIIVRLLLLVRS